MAGLGSDAPSTLWGKVRSLASADDARQLEAAWEHLQARYRPAMVAYARALLGRIANPHCPPSEAEDAVQGFLARCIERQWLAKADPQRGRFRVFVRVLLRRFVMRYLRERTAQKRAPGEGGMGTLDGLEDRLGDPGAPEVTDPFDSEWAECLVRGALERVAARSERNARLVAAIHAGHEARFEEICDELDIPEKARPVARHRARVMFAKELWEELKQTISSHADLEAERLLVLPYLSHYLDEDAAPSLYGG